MIKCPLCSTEFSENLNNTHCPGCYQKLPVPLGTDGKSGFNYLISYGGGIGPDVWEDEMQISAVDIGDALAQAKGQIEDRGGWIFLISQEDYPPTTREKLERERDEAKDSEGKALDFCIGLTGKSKDEIADAFKDAARLAWLDRQSVAFGTEDVHEGNEWRIGGPFNNLRDAIDSILSRHES